MIVAYQDYSESRNDRKFGETDRRSRSESVGGLSMNIDFGKETNRGYTLFYGFEAVYNDIGSTAFSENIISGIKASEATRYPDGSNKYYTLAGYVNGKKNFTEELTLLIGARYNYVGLSSTFVDNSFYNFPFESLRIKNNAVNGSVGLVYRPDIDWQFNINLASGFRAPNLDDVGKVFDSEPGSVVVPNEDLEPEYAYNIDLGIVKKIGEYARINLTGFGTLLDNAMIRRNFSFNGQDSIMYDGVLSKVEALVNEERAFIYGGHVSVLANISEKVSFKSSISYTHGKTSDGTPIRHASPMFGSTHIMFKTKFSSFDLYANYNGKKSHQQMPPSELAKPYMYAPDNNGNLYAPAWFTINLKTSWQIGNSISITTGVENILDHRYRPYSSGIVAPGRNFIFALRLSL
jgi:hemoglobin/transferrin/lactoferrin receptor protein